MKYSRRTFLKSSASASAAASLASTILIANPAKVLGAPSTLNKWPGRVVLNFNDQHRCTPVGGSASDQVILGKMTDDCIKMLTGKTDVGEAWKSIFPSTLSLSSKITIKVATLFATVAPHPFVIRGIVEGLKKMMIGGQPFPVGNITLYDRLSTAAGRTWEGAGLTADLFPGVAMLGPNASKHGDAPENRSYENALFNADFLINTCCIKGHAYPFAGNLSIGFKTHYGTFYVQNNDGDHNDDKVNLLMAMNCSGPVFAKNVLTVPCSFTSSNEGQWAHDPAQSFNTWSRTKDPSYAGSFSNTMIMSTDPVSAEFQAIKEIKINMGRTYAIADMPLYLKGSAGVTGLPGVTTYYNIGEIDETRMAYGEIVNNAIIQALNPPPVGVQRSTSLMPEEMIRVYPNPATNHVGIDFFTPGPRAGGRAEVAIYNFRGGLVRRLSSPVMGTRNTVIWDGRAHDGRLVAAGKYVVELRVQGRKMTGLALISR